MKPAAPNKIPHQTSNLPAVNSSPFLYDHPDQDVAALKRAIANKLIYTVGKNPQAASQNDWLAAAAHTVRDQLVERWMATTRAQYAQDHKRVYYLSMEFLIGRTFSNALLALNLTEPLRAALADFGLDHDALVELEPDAALGNGGLGRLAACFLDSMATLGVPGFGYGIRYDYGMFRQTIRSGEQVEVPDYWLKRGNPWEFPRPEVIYRVKFGGRIENLGGRSHWIDTNDVLAMAYDTIIPGHATLTTNTLRLWSARATEEIDLSAFNRGNYFAAVESKNHSENVSRVLYPDDSTLSGRELRLHQEYFFVSASVQDLIRRYRVTHKTFEPLPEKVSIHLNDTHPVLAIPELMRLLLDEQGLPWDEAWRLTQGVFSYTNHTLMHEALETWPVDLLGRVLPRHLEIIFDINAHFLKQVVQRKSADHDLLRRVSLIDEGGERRVRMAYLAVLASHSVNGVSALHSELMRQSIFCDFAHLFPSRFNNKTNGVTPRRWLAQANPKLAVLLDATLGSGWRRDLSQLATLRAHVENRELLQALAQVKYDNKTRLAGWVAQHMDLELDPTALFDVHVKRIHEYKRQLLNLLQVIARYQRIIEHPEIELQPRVVIFSGKAASAYHMAKQIIRLIHDVAQTIAADPRVRGRLQIVFIPNYSVSLAELIIPAADLSEQISTAGTEASGTGNMKLALNGAITIGTLDGANVEISEQVGRENIFIFGHTVPEVEALRSRGYVAQELYQGNPRLRRVLNWIRDGYFSPADPGRYRSIFDALVTWGDHYLLLADFDAYLQAQEAVDRAFAQPDQWSRMALHNIAGMGPFSSDRTIQSYVDQIWKTQAVILNAS